MNRYKLMTSLYSNLKAKHNWQPDNSIVQANFLPILRPLACSKGSLTAALSALSNDDFSVNVLSQVVATPKFHEQTALNRPLSRAAMIREVELKLSDTAVVFARSIIPLELVCGGRNGLANLGRTPLGHLLFKDGRIHVSKRQILHATIDGVSVSARRTPYDYQGSQILVSEYFLPTLNDYLLDR